MSDTPAPKAPPRAKLSITDVKFIKPIAGPTKVILKGFIPIADPSQSKEAITILSSTELKTRVYDNRNDFGLSDYAVERANGHRPYTELGKSYEHGAPVNGYEIEFRFTKRAG